MFPPVTKGESLPERGTQECDQEVTGCAHSYLHQALPVCFTEKLYWFTFPPASQLLPFELCSDVLPHLQDKKIFYDVSFKEHYSLPFILRTLIYLESAFVYIIRYGASGVFFLSQCACGEFSKCSLWHTHTTLLGLRPPTWRDGFPYVLGSAFQRSCVPVVYLLFLH